MEPEESENNLGMGLSAISCDPDQSDESKARIILLLRHLITQTRNKQCSWATDGDAFWLNNKHGGTITIRTISTRSFRTTTLVFEQGIRELGTVTGVLVHQLAEAIESAREDSIAEVVSLWLDDLKSLGEHD